MPSQKHESLASKLNGVAGVDAREADTEATFLGHRISVAAVGCVELIAQRMGLYSLIIDRYLSGCGRVGFGVG